MAAPAPMALFRRRAERVSVQGVVEEEPRAWLACRADQLGTRFPAGGRMAGRRMATERGCHSFEDLAGAGGGAGFGLPAGGGGGGGAVIFLRRAAPIRLWGVFILSVGPG